jgi:hypothetical protein
MQIFWHLFFMVGMVSISARAAEPISFTVLSKLTCQRAAGVLYQCKMPEKTIPSLGIKFHFVPLRTRLQITQSGNCSTAFPISVKVSTLGNPAQTVEISAIRNGRAILRTFNASSEGLKFADANDWLKMAQFDDSCSSSLSVWQDEIDFDSPEDFLKFLVKFSNQLEESVKVKNAFKELMIYRPAFDLLRAMSEVLVDQLNQTQATSVLDPDGSLTDLLEKAKGSSVLNLNATQRSALSRLQDFLEMQKTNEGWKGKRLVDFFNADDAAVFSKILNKNDRQSISSEDIKKYALQVEQLCTDLTQLVPLVENAKLIPLDDSILKLMSAQCRQPRVDAIP